MTAKAIDGSITKTSFKKFRLNFGVYEWTCDGGIMINDVTTMLYLIFKIMNTAANIGVLNLKYEIQKATLAKF